MPVVSSSDPLIFLLLHGFFIFIGVWHGYHIVRREYRGHPSVQIQLVDLCVIVLIAAAVGSRLPYLVYNAQSLLTEPLEVFRIWYGGVDFFGGFWMAFLCGMAYVRRQQWSLWHTADVFAPAVAMGIFWGKLGYIGLGYARGHELYRIYMLSPARFDWLNIYVVQGILAVLNLMIYFVLIAVRRKRKSAGQVFWVYVLMSSGCITLVHGIWKLGYLSWVEVISLPKLVIGCSLVVISAIALMVLNYREYNRRFHRWEDIPPAAGAAKSFGRNDGHSIQTK